MHIQFCGAAGEVTGSCTKLDIEQASILIDCGLFQGSHYIADRNLDPFPFNPHDIDAVVVTHAHLDHCGRLPKLVNMGYEGKLYATDATRDLVALILLDAAHIQEEDAERNGTPPLYTQEDVMHTMERFVAIPYDKEVTIANGVSASLHNAGHVVGSSFIRIKGEGKSVIFSGDIGNYPVPLLEKAEDLPQADAMILESTYGDRTHGSYEEGIEILEQAIRDTVKEKGVLLIPAFSLERTQELLTVIDKALGEQRVPQISAYLDGPLGIKVSRVYEKYDHYFNKEIQALEDKESDHSVLTFPSLTITEKAEQSKMINDVDPPKLIIAGSGMMMGGRILHHLKRYLPFENTRLLIVGYQVKESLGRRLLDGATEVKVHGEPVQVKAKVIVTPSFSSHMDKEQLITWINTMPNKPKTIFLNHGDDDARANLSKEIEALGIKTEVPRFGQGYEIGQNAETKSDPVSDSVVVASSAPDNEDPETPTE